MPTAAPTDARREQDSTQTGKGSVIQCCSSAAVGRSYTALGATAAHGRRCAALVARRKRILVDISARKFPHTVRQCDDSSNDNQRHIETFLWANIVSHRVYKIHNCASAPSEGMSMNKQCFSAIDEVVESGHNFPQCLDVVRVHVEAYYTPRHQCLACDDVQLGKQLIRNTGRRGACTCGHGI